MRFHSWQEPTFIIYIFDQRLTGTEHDGNTSISSMNIFITLIKVFHLNEEIDVFSFA